MISTMQAKTLFRPATLEDCYTIARLFQIASDGVSYYIWSTLVSEYPGLTLLEIGAKRYTNEDGLFSYKNCVGGTKQRNYGHDADLSYPDRE